MKRKILIFSAALLAVVLALLLAFLLLYGPNFGIYLRKPSPQSYGERALTFMENGYYSSAEEWREAKAAAQDALRAAQRYEDTWPILCQALSAAGGKHSRLITPSEEEEAREDPITLPLVSTNTIFRLYDGTQIVLTVGADVALRTGEVFCEEPIPPDVLTDSPEQEAAAWIRSR